MYTETLLRTRQFSTSSIRQYNFLKRWSFMLHQSCSTVKQTQSKVTTCCYKRIVNSLKKHCLNPIGLKYRNAHKTYTFYRRLYEDYGRRKLITTVLKKFQPSRPACTFAAAACTFSWEENGYSETEIQEHIDELTMLETVDVVKACNLQLQEDCQRVPSSWIKVMDKPNIKIWKLPFKETGYMQYKVYGKFDDVSARQFFTVQVDLEYRRKWDNLVVDISVVDENKTSGEQVLRWISCFPTAGAMLYTILHLSSRPSNPDYFGVLQYPLKAREYVYIRRATVLPEKNVMVLLAKSVDHPKCETARNHVRVPLYVSDMVIKPHKSMDEPGLDYLLTYCDNPQTKIPSRLSSWAVTVGIPDYINKLHKASMEVNTIETNHLETTTANDAEKLDTPCKASSLHEQSQTSRNTVETFNEIPCVICRNDLLPPVANDKKRILCRPPRDKL